MGEGNERNSKCFCGSGKKYKKCCMNKIFISREELNTHFIEQIQFLVMSANSYDTGFLAEAKRMAVIIRNLLHDTTNSTSILKQMNKKDISFLDTSPDVHPLNLLSHNGLCMHRLTSGNIEESGLIPRLNDSPFESIHTNFENWWNKVVIKDSYGKEFKRKDLILLLSNVDGGAHVDPQIDIDYYNLTRNNSLGWKIFIDGNEYDDKAPHFPSVRQITHEVIISLQKDYNTDFGYKV